MDDGEIEQRVLFFAREVMQMMGDVPGQSFAAYRGDELLGGARILRAHR